MGEGGILPSYLLILDTITFIAGFNPFGHDAVSKLPPILRSRSGNGEPFLPSSV